MFLLWSLIAQLDIIYVGLMKEDEGRKSFFTNKLKGRRKEKTNLKA